MNVIPTQGVRRRWSIGLLILYLHEMSEVVGLASESLVIGGSVEGRQVGVGGFQVECLSVAWVENLIHL